MTALLPVAAGVAVHAALSAAADTARAAGDARSSGQVLADTLVERVTGRSQAEPCDPDLRLVMTDRCLLDGDDEPARVRRTPCAPPGAPRCGTSTTSGRTPTVVRPTCSTCKACANGATTSVRRRDGPPRHRQVQVQVQVQVWW